jgi:DNA-binding transcriptional LysR family regulator
MLPLIELCEAGLGLAALPRFALTSGCSDLKEAYPIPESLEHHLWVLTHRDLIKSTRIGITTEFLYRELKPFFSIH